ncbi:unnamed protein product [Diamesa tonsa]
MKCLVLLVLMINLVLAKQYERCQLARELYQNHNVAMEDVGMLVCIAEEGSNLNTALNSKANGLFQLNGNWWCSKYDDTVKGCDMKCTDLIDDDITDDVKCVKKIISVQGLDAWGQLKIFTSMPSKSKWNYRTMFSISSKFWCLENEVGGGCIMKCSDLSDDDIADDVKCAKRIVSVEGFNAFVLLETCNSKSREIITECFGNVLNLDKCTNSVNITSEVKETESTLSNKGTLQVELVNLLADSIKSIDASPTSTKFNGGTPLTINNYIMFNINGDGLDEISWCSNDDTVKGCDMKCTDLIDDDITDDVKCVKQIISVQGFDAWGVKHQCLPKASGIVNQCFPNELHSGETQHVIVKDESEESVEHADLTNWDVNSFYDVL